MTVTFADVTAAAERTGPYIHRTPVLTSELLDELTGARLFFKCENLQKAGAFKARGAVNAVFSLPGYALDRGVATHSSGNHGAALARAAALRGVRAYIVVPENAKQVKKDAILGYGAEVIECEPTLAAREAMLASVIAKTNAIEVHPYDDPVIIAGQGTAGLELSQQVPGLDALVVPVGGGGLLAGCSLVAAERQITVYGAEPAGAADGQESLRTGNRVRSHVPDTICDGLLTTLGEQNFEIIRQHVRDILVVDDAAVVEAMKLIWTRMKIVVEPSAAITLAVVLHNPDLFAGKRTGLVLTGGNVDLANLPF